MPRRVALPVLLLGLLVGLSPARSEPLEDALRAFDAETTAVVVDRQGVRTELTAFGPLFGPDFLVAFHGDAQVQVPFRKIRAFRVGALKDRWAPLELVLRDGSVVTLQLEPTEYATLFAGNASFGYYRIALGKIASCEFQEPTREEGSGRRCPSGHLFYNDAWRFCPYDGKPLAPIVPTTSEGGR